MKELYVIKDGKRLRCGYTTGSCAAAAAKAAVIGLVSGIIPEYVEIETPAGIDLRLKVEKPVVEGEYTSCCIVKDAGDDPDATDGIEIFARASRRKDNIIVIDGGFGIGRITHDCCFGKKGEAAINRVPKKMIEKEVRKEADGGYDILIYAPLGEEIGKKTFNANIGIEGGISIIGTKGIVEPMSEDALKESIYIEVDALYESGIRDLILYPGNYGEEFSKKIGITEPGVKISNYVGDIIQYCYNKGFGKITLIGNIGKLCKVSIGIFNTHSRVCDGRIEAFIYYLALAEAPFEIINRIKNALTAEEALKIIIEEGNQSIIEAMKRGCIENIRKYVKDEGFNIEIIMYSMNYGLL